MFCWACSSSLRLSILLPPSLQTMTKANHQTHLLMLLLNKPVHMFLKVTRVHLIPATAGKELATEVATTTTGPKMKFWRKC